MPKLSDYLGQIASAMAQARQQSDIESVRLADQYAGHPLLKLFPVPRFRIMNVKLDLPIAIRGGTSPSPSTGSASPQHVDSNPSATWSERLLAQLDAARIKLKPAAKARFAVGIQKHDTYLKQPPSLPTSITYVVDDVVNLLRKELPGVSGLASADRERILSEFKETARVELLRLQPAPSQIDVIVDTAELRDLGPLDVITRIELTLVEEGMEWKQTESGGNIA
ncbi:MAG: hypothetical protein WCS94_24720, partial [Verrucomicrobiota bacterium]